MKRTLALHGEHLAELTSDELTEVVGGITQWCNTIHYCNIPTLPITGCLPPPE